MIKVVVFDVDNTLIDSIGAVKPCIESGANAIGITLPDNFMDLYYEADKFICDEIKAGRQTRVSVGPLLWTTFLHSFGSEDKLNEFCSAYSQSAFDNLKTIDGAKEILEYASKKYPLAIASNSSPVPQKRRLEKVGLLGYFSKFCFSGALGCEKPQKAFFEALIKEVGVLPNEIFYVGDSYRVDIEGAKACEITTCWYDYNKTGTHPPCADYATSSLVKIKEFI